MRKGRTSIKLFTRNRASAMADSEICITKTVSRPDRFFASAKPRYRAIYAQLNRRMPLPFDPAGGSRREKLQ